MSVGARLFALFAVVGAPLAWVAQLVLGYSLEEAACSPGDGNDVWGTGVRTLHVAVGVVALAVAVAALLAAVALRVDGRAAALDARDRGFLGSFGVVGGLLFVLTIVLTGVGSTVLSTCHGG